MLHGGVCDPGEDVARIRIEHDEAHSAVAMPVGWRAEALRWKALDLAPGLAAVVAAPESVVPRAEQQRRCVVGVHRQALTETPAVLVAAHLERDADDVPGISAIVAAKDRRGRRRVHAGGDVHGVRVLRVRRDALDAVIAVVPDIVFERNPALLRVLPAVNAADIGPEIGKVLLGR